MKTSGSIFFGVLFLVSLGGFALSQDRPAPAAVHQTKVSGGGTKATASSDLPVICHIEKRGKTITVKAGPKGPVYSVKTADGKILFENISGERLRAQAPELYDFIKTAVAETRGKGASDARVRVKMDASAR